jgi:hypothetical protein
LGRLNGYAPTVDLGEKGLLFLTFEPANSPGHINARNDQFFCAMDDMWRLPFAAYGKPHSSVSGNREDRKVVLRTLLQNSGPRDVPSAYVTQFGRFLDINDPNMFVQFAPAYFELNLGKGIKLKRVTLELTRDAVTPPPEKWPKWLKETGPMSHVLSGWPSPRS